MKGATQGPKVTQVSLILIVFVCATVIALAWTKTTFLASLVPTQNRVLQLDLGPEETLEQNSTSVQTGLTQVDSLSHSRTELGSERGDAVKYTREGETSVAGTIVSDELLNQQKKSQKAESAKVYSSNVESSVEREHSRNLPTNTGNKDCNYGKGKWVHDDNWPIYSGDSCKQWLSPMWACRLTQRTDFEYEKLRWKPKNCKMEKFTGAKFLNRMRSKTLAFVGDSLGRQQFQSLMCMVTGGEKRPDILDVGHEYGLVRDQLSVRPDGWAYRFPQTNTTILYYWSASLCDLEPIDPSKRDTDIAMHLDRPPAFLRRYLNKLDVLVLNTGHHWNRGKLKANRWVMYVGGYPNTDRKIATVGGAKDLTIHSIVKWVDSQLPSHPHLKAFLRSLAPRHFFNGEWNTGGTCDNTTPLSGGKEVIDDKSSDILAADAANGTSVKLLDITGLSQLRDEGHISRYSIKATPGVQDCLHWCLPGIPDTWNEILFNQL